MTVGMITRSGILLGVASRWERLLGQCIDSLCAGAPVAFAALLTVFIGQLAVPLMLLAFAWTCFYLLFGDGLHEGQSFAKQWFGMRVVDATTGHPCTFGQSFVRNITLTFLGPFDWIFIFGDQHQRLGDKLANTLVVDAD